MSSVQSSFTIFFILFLGIALGTSISRAATVTVGPTGTYASPCAAFAHLADYDTVVVDANGGTPYYEGNCFLTNNFVTVTGINGRPILDGKNTAINKGIWVVDGHDDVIDNFEFRNAGNLTGNSGSQSNGAGIKAEDGYETSGGGDITVQRCYIHDNGDGFLSGSPGDSAGSSWNSTSNYITLQYDEFGFNGAYNGVSDTHNIYAGDDTVDNTVFTMKYSWSHDSEQGQLVKDREPFSNIYYNLITDTTGFSNYLMDFPDASTAYVVGNVIYKAPTSNNEVVVSYGNNFDAPSPVGFYASHQDLHFVNNTVIDDPANTFPGYFISIQCFGQITDSCGTSGTGNTITTPALIENNIFMGGSIFVPTNQSEAIVSHNVTETNNPTNMTAMHFNNPSALDFRLVSTSSPAYLAGLYPPTNNVGATDPMELATEEVSFPMAIVSRPTPTGSTMDAGAYHEQTVAAPTLTLSYTTTITSPNTGTITVSGMPTPASGTYNYVTFLTGNIGAIAEIPSIASSTTSATTTYTALPVGSSTVVPVYIYANGQILTASITVNPGPPAVESLTLDDQYLPKITLHMSGGASSPITVDLSSSDPTILTVPATLSVPAHTTSLEIGSLDGSLWTPAITALGPVTVTATYGTSSAQLTTDIYSPGVHGYNCEAGCTIAGGQIFEMGFVLAGISPVGGSTIYLTSSNTAVIPNQTYVLPAGATGPTGSLYGYGYFDVTTNSVSSSTAVTLTVTYNGQTDEQGPVVETVTPGPGPTVTSVTLDNTYGPSTTVHLSGNAPSGGALVSLTSSNPSILYAPATITVPSGSSTAETGTLDGSLWAPQLSSEGPVTLTATFGSSSAHLTTSIYSPEIYNFACSSCSVVGGNSYNYVGFQLSGLSPEGGSTIYITSNNTAVIPDQSFVIPAGAGTIGGGYLSIATNSVSSSTVVTLTATYDGSAYSTHPTITVTPSTSVTISSVTQDNTYLPYMTVHLSGAAPAGGSTVSLSSSNTTYLWAPATMTVPQGATSAEAGTLEGSLWTPALSSKGPVTLTATLGTSSQHITTNIWSPQTYDFSCATCTVVGGDPLTYVGYQLEGVSPEGGSTVYITSSNTAVIPNQSVFLPAGATGVPGGYITLNTNAVSTSTNVVITCTYDGSAYSTTPTVTVTPM